MRRYGKNFRELAPPLQRGFNLGDSIRQSGGFPEAEPVASNPVKPRSPRRKQSRDRLVEQAGVGADERDTDGDAERNQPPAGVLGVDGRVACSSLVGAGSCRTLLQGFTLPLPTTDNSTHDVRIVKPKFGKNGKPPRAFASKYTTHEYEAFKARVKDLLLEARAWHYSESPVEMCVLVSYRDKRRNDLANRLKALQDALKGYLIMDDSQIKTLEVREGPIIKTGMVKVTMREILFEPVENLRWINQR